MTDCGPLSLGDNRPCHERPMDRIGALHGAAISRYSDRPLGLRDRLYGMTGTALICAAIPCACLFSWHIWAPPPKAYTPLVTTFEPLAAPPEPRVEMAEGPKQQPQRELETAKAEQPPAALLAVPLPRPILAASEAAQPAQQAMAAITQNTAPKAIEAPPAPQRSSSDRADWQSRLLAHLEQHRHYPPISMSRREEGVAYLKFSMNRTGTLLSSKIIRSSGSARLDRAALDTLKRAQPLPAIPNELPDPLELTVPVEFFIS